MKPLRIFVGYDTREPVAYHVLAHSIIRHASGPVSITPLALSHLGSVYQRPPDPKASTQFSLTRFLVPYLCGYQGRALYMDCDMLVRDDLHKIVPKLPEGPNAFLPAECDKAAWVVKHDYVPRDDQKFLGQRQTCYPRKNWSSFMVFDNPLCRDLTLEYVNTATPLALHRFHWLDAEVNGYHYDGDDSIGEFPLEWNHLVGEDNQCPIEDAKVLHWTNGGPWFRGYEGAPAAEEWFRERNAMLNPCGIKVPDVVREPEMATPSGLRD